MGLKSEWRAKFEEMSPDAFLKDSDYVAGSHPVRVIVDGSVLMWKLTMCHTSWDDLFRATASRLRQALNPTLCQYIFVTDEKAPINKQATQLKRQGDRKDIIPFTEKEMNRLFDEPSLIIGDKTQFFERLLQSRGGKTLAVEWIAASLLVSGSTMDILDIVIDAVNPQRLQKNVHFIEEHFVDKELYKQPIKWVVKEVITDATGLAVVRLMHGLQTLQRPIYSVYHQQVKERRKELIETEPPIIYMRPQLDHIGEADHKIIRYLAEVKEDLDEDDCVWIYSNDNDTFGILPPALIDLINLRTQKVFQIFVDLTARQSTKQVRLHFNRLWFDVASFFKRQFQITHHSWHIMNVLMLLSGGDYTTSLKQIGVEKIWEVFSDKGGHELFRGTGGTETIKDADGQLVPRPDEGSMFPTTDEVIGYPTIRHQVKMNEWMCLMFIKLLYADKVILPKLRKQQQSKLFSPSDDEIREELMMKWDFRKMKDYCDRVIDSTYVDDKNRYQMKDQPALSRIVRQIAWNMDYWINGWKCIAAKYYDPLAIDLTTGLSIWGWSLEKDRVVNATQVFHPNVKLDSQ